MKTYKRKITENEEKDNEIIYYGFNSNNVLSIVFDDGLILNFKGDELYKLKKFLDMIRI